MRVEGGRHEQPTAFRSEGRLFHSRADDESAFGSGLTEYEHPLSHPLLETLQADLDRALDQSAQNTGPHERIISALLRSIRNRLRRRARQDEEAEHSSNAPTDR